MYDSFIEVKGQYEGFHAYEQAPQAVAFLRDRHRHLFKWSAQIEVFHDDRELEFFIVQHYVEIHAIPTLQTLDNAGSCESQAKWILDKLKKAYGDNRFYAVSVSEDGENGGIVTWTPNRQDSN